MLSEDKTIFHAEISKEVRKPLSLLTNKGLKVRLAPLINLIETLATKEGVDTKTIASYALQLVSSSSRDLKTASFCREIISKGSFGQHFPIDKSAFLLDQLEIGKRKYIELRKLLKSENVHFPPYLDVAHYRTDITIANELQLLWNKCEYAIGIRIPYNRILQQTVSRLIDTLPEIKEDRFPLSMKISDGLDGSGSHQIYNQLQPSSSLSSKNFLLFAFKIISIQDSLGSEIWVNTLPNSHFHVRPIALVAMRENEENVISNGFPY